MKKIDISDDNNSSDNTDDDDDTDDDDTNDEDNDDIDDDDIDDDEDNDDIDDDEENNDDENKKKENDNKKLIYENISDEYLENLVDGSKNLEEEVLDDSIFDDDNFDLNSKLIKLDESNLEVEKSEKMNLNKMKVEDLRNLVIKSNKEPIENIQKLKKSDLIKLLKDKK